MRGELHDRRDADAGVALAEVTAYLDAYLRIREVPDYDGAVNGLQVENGGHIDGIVAAVDASQATIDGVIGSLANDPAMRRPLLLVHHGLLWDGNQPLTGRRYRRIAPLLAHDLALYSAHLPLDLHAEVGNNAVLARELGVTVEGGLGAYRGAFIGLHGTLDCTRDELVARVDALLGTRTRLIPGGPERVRRIGIISGGAGRSVREAASAGLDTFLTGEGTHDTYFDAMELGVNLLYGGHYATETVGVQALAAHLAERFSLPWRFHDHPTGL